MKYDKQDKVVKVPDALGNPLYRLIRKAVIAADLRKSLIGTKDEVLAKAAKMNAKNRHFIMPTDSKAHYTDHLIQGQYHCVETNIEKIRRRRKIMCCGHDVPEKYLATAHGDFRNAPITHFYYGSAETLYAFAPSYAESYRNAGAKCVIHVGKGMHHCYALQYFISGCKHAFDEIIRLIRKYFNQKVIPGRKEAM